MQAERFEMSRQDQPKHNVQIIWAGALILAGLAVFFRIPQVMPQLAQMWQSEITLWAFRICFYLMGILLIGGGVKKIVQFFRHEGNGSRPRTTSEGDSDSDR